MHDGSVYVAQPPLGQNTKSQSSCGGNDPAISALLKPSPQFQVCSVDSKLELHCPRLAFVSNMHRLLHFCSSKMVSGSYIRLRFLLHTYCK